VNEITTPSITGAQVIAIVTAALATAASFGFTLSDAQQHAVLADVALAVAIVFGDGIVRHGRSKVAAVIAAQAVAPKE